MRLRFFALCLLAAFGLAAPSGAQDVTLIVSRNASVTSLYVRAPADDTGGFLASTARIDPGASQTPLTFADAQARATAAMRIAADTLILEADGMSVPLTGLPALLHRSDDPLLFETPLDGSVASAFCATPDRLLPEISELTLYSGFRAQLPFDAGPLSLYLPQATGPITVRVYHRGDLMFEGPRHVDETGHLSLAAPAAQHPLWPYMAVLVILAGAAAAAARLRLMHRGPNRKVVHTFRRHPSHSR